jgi:CDP-diacylglycerol---glycerol-3-phosphate 3-phosphatidyltransferase
MLNKLRPLLARVLTPAGEALARTPLTPNAITIIGTVGVAAGALTLYPIGELFAGTVVCTVFVLADMLDGALARVKGTSGKFGAFLDSTLDRVADAAIFGGLACYYVLQGHGRADRVMAGVALFCLVAGALVSYAKARAEGLGLRCDVGIAERPERMVTVLLAAGLSGLGVPYVLPVGLWLLAAASAFTFGQRVLAVRRAAAAEAEATKAQAPEAQVPEARATEARATGPEATGPEATGPEATEAEATGPEATGPEATEAEATEAESG